MEWSRGTRLGHYEILSPLGAGGMGVVYLAFDPRLQRNVALKLLPAGDTTDPGARQQLLGEARAAAALNHANICTVHEVGEADGHAFIAMELVEGEPLSARIAHDTLDSAKAIRLGTQLAAALEHGHQRGVVHGDLKSANVMVTPGGTAKVVDFGLATRRTVDVDGATRTGLSLDQPGAVAGTLAYMSPELLRGNPADARSDVWALGVVLYEMVTGRLPFARPSPAEITSAILRDSPPALPPGVPATLTTVIRRCLEKDSADRYQRAGEVRAALELIQPDPSADHHVPADVRSPFRARRIAVGTMLLFLAGVGGVGAFFAFRNMTPPAAGPRTERSIAVLPFDNLSHDSSQDYFSDGMTEALISNLGQIRALTVISRTTVMRYKGGERKPLPDIARELDVNTVIEGSVLAVGDRVRVSINVVDARSDRQLWTDSFERDLRDILSLQSDIAGKIASRFNAQLTGVEKARLSTAVTVDPKAHDLYLRGRYLTHSGSSDALKKAIEYLQQATAAAPQFAPGWAALALAYQQRDIWGGLGLGASDVPAKAAAERALALDDTLAEAHLALAVDRFNRDWDWTASEASFRRALELNPNLPDAYMHRAYLLQALGRDAEAMASVERAVAIDPYSARWRSDEGRILYRAGRFEEAIDRYERSRELDQNYLPPLSRSVQAYEQLGRYADARRLIEQIEMVQGRPATPLWANFYALTGKKQEALNLAREIERDGGSPFALASAYTALGDFDRALGFLEKGVRERSMLPFQLRDPALDALKKLPRYQALLQEVRLPVI